MQETRMPLIAMILSVSCALPTMAENPIKRKPDTRSVVRSVKGGRLSRKGDFYLLHLKGTWYEMGHAHGELLREQVRKNTTDIWKEKVVPMLGEVPAKLLRTMSLSMRPMLPEEIREELRGIADGSGVALEDLELATLLGGPLVYAASRESGLGEVNLRPSCSSFVAFGQATHDKKLIYTHNFDFMKEELGIHNRPLCAAYEPVDGRRFCTLGWAGMLFVVTGLNESKITVGCIGATSAAETPFGLPMGLIVRKVLQDAHDLDEAEKIIRKSRRMCGFNYVAGDGKAPEGRVYETNARAVATFGPNQRSKDDPKWMLHVKDALFRADTAMNPTVRDKQTCARGRPDVPGLESPVGSGSYDARYKVIGDLLRKWHGKVDMGVGIKIMQTAAMPEANVQSFVCNSSDLVFRVAVAKGAESAHKRSYVRFDFRELFRPAPKREGQAGPE